MEMGNGKWEMIESLNAVAETKTMHRVAQIGCGQKGTSHARSHVLVGRSQIVAAADPDEENLALFCERFDTTRDRGTVLFGQHLHGHHDDAVSPTLADDIADEAAEAAKNDIGNTAEEQEELANQLDHGLYGATAITKGMKDGRILLQNTVAGVAPYVARILVRQTIIENIEHLRLKLIERSKEQKEKLARPIKKRTEDRAERLTINVGRFMGSLNEIQNNLVNRYAESTINDAKRRLDNRNLRQSALLTFLAGKPNEIEIDAFIRQIVLRSHEIVDPDYQGYSEERIARFTTLLVTIFAASTNDQRQATSEKLRSYAQDFSEISN